MRFDRPEGLEVSESGRSAKIPWIAWRGRSTEKPFPAPFLPPSSASPPHFSEREAPMTVPTSEGSSRPVTYKPPRCILDKEWREEGGMGVGEGKGGLGIRRRGWGKRTAESSKRFS